MAKLINFHYTFLHVLVVIFTPFVVVHGTKPRTTITLCGQAPYPEICTYLIGKSSVETPLEVRQMTLMSTLAQAKHAHKLVLAMDTNSFEPRAKSAWTDCLELYDDTVYQLNRSLGSTNDALSGFSKYISNSLAINKALTPLLTSSKGRTLEERNNFPKWLSKSDRKLLATPSSATSADLVVSQDGSGDYETLSEAIAALPKLRKGTSRFVIYVKAGVYKENVDIKKTMHKLMFVGDGIGSTIVTSGKNNQDVYGTLDFIFGNAAAVLQSCNIYVRKPMGGQANAITAQARSDPNQNTSIIIHNSAVTAASDLRGSGGSVKTYLGRPWMKYSRTVYMKCSLDSLINSAGWPPWSGSFALSTLYYVYEHRRWRRHRW
ncbi:hypothetical protein L1987_79297 [Smallanthus sonchifolius]|uniref:Uncharacterized protein n=1 Tax=Smallanthus sonchifolius TaxID=185202 RepID=A0ACB8ZG39_9ASTR|nr:hypothetical protein L1987_79297 [Smallanthus sonchifolius]